MILVEFDCDAYAAEVNDDDQSVKQANVILFLHVFGGDMGTISGPMCRLIATNT